jgi:hypothetical protein
VGHNLLSACHNLFKPRSRFVTMPTSLCQLSTILSF